MGEELTEATYRSRPIAIGGLVLAGIPILVTSTQAISDLTGGPVESWPVLGPVSSGIKEIPIFQRMATVFEPSPPILALFVLIGISWFVLCLSLFRPLNVLRDYSREVRGWSVGSTTVLYALLFLWSYWELFTSGLALGEFAVLSGLPVIVFVGIGLAYKTQPRTNGNRLLNVADETLENLDEELNILEDRFERQLNGLNSDIKDNIGTLDVQEIESRRQQIQSLRDEVEEQRSLAENERDRAARQLLEDDIQPLQRADFTVEAEDAIRRELTEWLADQFGSVEFRSEKYGKTYQIGNREKYKYIDISIEYGDVNISRQSVNEIDGLAETLAEESIPIDQVITAVNTVAEHIKYIYEDIESKETEFVEVVEEAEAGVERAKERIDDLPGKIKTRLNTAYRKGGVDDLSHMGTIKREYGPSEEEGDLDEAIQLHHDCRFSTALDLAENAQAKANELDEVVNFVRKITLTVDEKVDSISVPQFNLQTNPFFARELISKDIDARLSGVTLEPDWEAGRIKYHYLDEQSVDVEDDISNDDSPPEYIVRDGVRWLFNALKTEEIGEVQTEQSAGTNGSSPDVVVEIDQNKLPSAKSDPAVIERAAEHVASQSRLDANVDSEFLPEKLLFKLNSKEGTGITQRDIGDVLLDSFTSEADMK